MHRAPATRSCMRHVRCLMAAAAIVASAAVAGAGLPGGGARIAAQLTTYGDPYAPVYVGVPNVFDGVAKLLITKPTGVFGCSGSLIGAGMYLLTAAHCVSNDRGAIDASSVSAVFAAAAGVPVRNIAAGSIITAPGWTGDFRAGADLALLRLDRPVAANSYDIVRTTNRGLGENFVIAGYGRAGSGGQGSDAIGFGTLRVGTNRYDTHWPSTHFADQPLAYDFDDGTAARDTIGNLITALRHLGTGITEASIAPGDSGGPSFLDALIVGVHSFGATYGLPFDLDDRLNASFGELAGDTQVARYAAWIDALVPRASIDPAAGNTFTRMLKAIMRTDRVKQAFHSEARGSTAAEAFTTAGSFALPSHVESFATLEGVAPVPEPRAYLLFAIGLGVVLCVARRTKHGRPIAVR